METMIRPLVDWGSAASPLPGEVESGDRCIVKLSPDRAIAGVIDGLGHGRRAAQASRAAVEVLESFADEPIISLFHRCHRRLRSTQGVVMTLVAFQRYSATMRWLGVGNVSGVLMRAGPDADPAFRGLLIRSGVVGLRLPLLETSAVSVTAGDTLVLATDGLNGDFVDGLTCHDSPQHLAERLLAEYKSGNDDALVLVVRYCGDQ